MRDWLIKIGLASIAALAPIHEVLIATGVIIFIDLVTGLWRAIKAKETISSGIMRRTITKFLVYQLAIITGFLIETYLLKDIPITKLVSGVIGLVEAKSVLENLNDIYGGDLFKALLKRLDSDNAKETSDPKLK